MVDKDKLIGLARSMSPEDLELLNDLHAHGSHGILDSVFSHKLGDMIDDKDEVYRIGCGCLCGPLRLVKVSYVFQDREGSQASRSLEHDDFDEEDSR